MICIHRQEFWDYGLGGDTSLSQPFHAVCHLFRYLNQEPSSREDAVTVWNTSIKLWTRFVLLSPCLLTPPIQPWTNALPPKSPHHGVITRRTASAPFPLLPKSYTIFCSHPQLRLELWLLGKSRDMHFERTQGLAFVCSGAAAKTAAVSHLGPQTNKYGAYRDMRPNQAAQINIYF